MNASTANVDVARAAYLPRFDSPLADPTAPPPTTSSASSCRSRSFPRCRGRCCRRRRRRASGGARRGGLFSWEPFDFGLRGATVREAEAGVVRARADEGLTRLAVQNAVGGAFLGVVERAAGGRGRRRRRGATDVARPCGPHARGQSAASGRRGVARRCGARRRADARHPGAAGAGVAQTTLGTVLGDRRWRRGRMRAAPARAAARDARHRSAAAPRRIRWCSRVRRPSTSRARARRSWPRPIGRGCICSRASSRAAAGRIRTGSSMAARTAWGSSAPTGRPACRWSFRTCSTSPACGRGRRPPRASRAPKRARYDEAVLTVTSQQRTAGAMVDAARAIAQNTPIQLAAAQQSEAQARARYEAGLASIVEVAEAQSLLAAGGVSGCGRAGGRVARAAGAGRRAGKRRAVHRARFAHAGVPVAMWLIRAALRRPITVLVAVIAVALTAVFAVTPDAGGHLSRTSICRSSTSPSRTAAWTRRRWRGSSPTTTSTTSSTSPASTTSNRRTIQGAALMKLTFHPGTDMAQAMAETIGYVNRSRAFMPPGTVPPFVMRFDAGSVPVGYLVLLERDAQPRRDSGPGAQPRAAACSPRCRACRRRRRSAAASARS